jgi:hypothetical protein
LCNAATQFTSGSSPCITIPTLPVPANAVASPPPAAGVLSYSFTCAQPGFRGSSQNFTYDLATNSFVYQAWDHAMGRLVTQSAPTSCVACNSATEFSSPVPGGFQCKACSSIDPNLVVSSSIWGYAGTQQCGCANHTYSNGWAGVETGLRCSACTTGSDASGSSTTCTGSANFQCTGVSSSLACFCTAGFVQSDTGYLSSCVPVTPTPSGSSTPSFSATISLSPSVTPTSSSTATPTATRSPSQSMTPTSTPTPSQTPSPSTVPDVVVSFNMTIASSQGPVTASFVASSAAAAFLAQSAAAFARAIVVPSASVFVVAVTDVATGQSFKIGSLRRELASAGSLGAAVTFVVRLGKTPTQAQVLNISNMLASPAAIRGALAASAASFATAAGVDVRWLSAGVPAGSVLIANAPFSLAAPAAAAASSADSGASTGGIVGGIIAALALACAIWGARSWAKHGKLPCFRDRRRELFFRREEKAEQELVASAIAEAEAALEVAPASADAASKPAVAPRPSKPKPKGQDAASVVRKLAQKSAAAEAENAALRKQLATAKTAGADAEELAELRRQLAAAKAAAAAAAPSLGDVGVANPAVAFAPSSMS